MTPPSGFDVVGEFESNGNGKVEFVERAARVGGAFTNRVEEDIGRLGEERVADPPVGKLTREPKIVRAECCDVDRYVRWRHERADAAAFAMGQRELIDLAVVIEALARSDRSDDVDRLARRCTGLSKRTPCHPSITWGPLVPMPSTNRPPESACIESADIASIAGVRAPSCTMPVANRMVDVRATRNTSGVKASPAQNSGTHTESTPSCSACWTKSTDVRHTALRRCRSAASRGMLREVLDSVEGGPHVRFELLEPASDDAFLLFGHHGDRNAESRRRRTTCRSLTEPHTIRTARTRTTKSKTGRLRR